jgi:uncharacterized protein (TIGR02145 family)
MKRTMSVLVAGIITIGLFAQEKFIDSRDGNSYRTITIAGKTWMAENLKFVAEGTGSFCFDNNPENLASYGVLYDWKSAAVSCPAGWRLPTGVEFRMLMDNFDSDDSKGHLKSGPVTYGLQLAGMQTYEGIFTEMDESGYYWTSTEYNDDEAEFFSYLLINGNSVYDISRKEDMPDIHGAEKKNKYSVRCIKADK